MKKKPMANKQTQVKAKTGVKVYEKIIVGVMMVAALSAAVAFVVGLTSVLIVDKTVVKEVVTIDPAALGTTSGEAIIILSSNTLYEMNLVRDYAEELGGTITSVFSPSAMIGNIPFSAMETLEATTLVDKVSYDTVDASSYLDQNSSLLDGLSFWNNSLTEATGVEDRQFDGYEPEIFSDEIIITEIPETDEEKNIIEVEYIEKWAQEKIDFQQEELDNLITPGITSEDIDASTTSTTGTASGAGYYDTSLYLAGDIAVGVFFDSGTAGSWNAADIDDYYINVTNAISEFTVIEPNANLTFHFKKEVVGGVPNPWPTTYGGQYDYVNTLRNTENTDWAYMIRVINGSGTSNANYYGPSTSVYRYIQSFDNTVRHESMHIFGANDQYLAAEQSPTERLGYLNVVNANSAYNDGNGYFGGAGEGISDLMLNTYTYSPIGVYSRGQVGWRDSDGDGILDPMDTYPVSILNEPAGSNILTYTGLAQDMPLPNEVAGFNDVSINSIDRVEYRINNSAWVEASLSVVAGEPASKNFIFTTPDLQDGSYLIEVRATNSVGNTELLYAKDEVLISGSTATNTRPFAKITVSPEVGSTSTIFDFNASSSTDFEDEFVEMSVKWDFDDNGSWDSTQDSPSHSYTSAGLKTVKLEVRDIQGMTHTVTKQVNVLSSNTEPTVVLTATPENQFGNAQTFSVDLDASGSWDGESLPSQLQARWDFEDDGIWDTSYSLQKSTTHNYIVPRELPTTSYNLNWARGVFAVSNKIYVADGFDNLKIFDTADMNSPVTVPLPANSHATDVEVVGSFAYISAGDNGLVIIDLNDNSIEGNVIFDNSWAVAVEGNYAYVAVDGDGLKVVNISTKSNPQVEGSIDTNGNVRDVVVSGSYAYVADGAAGLQVINISIPGTPTLQGSPIKTNADGTANGVYISSSYLYLADGHEGLQIYNLSTPSLPAALGRYDTSGYARKVHVVGSLAYLADSASGLQIINVASPNTPTLVTTSSIIKGGYETVYVLGDYAYVGKTFSSLSVIDISTPYSYTVLDKSTNFKARVEVTDGTNISQATRDIWVVTYNNAPSLSSITATIDEFDVALEDSDSTTGNATGIDISGNFAFVSEVDGGMDIYNIGTPTNPSFVKHVNTDANGHSLDVKVDGNYAYLADHNSMDIINIENPATAAEVGTIGGLGNVYGVSVINNYAYVATDSNGVRIVNIQNKNAPSLLRTISTSGAKDIFIDGDYAYVADGTGGFKIIGNITNYASANVVGQIDDFTGVAWDVYVSGNYAFVAAGSSGLRVYDVSNKTNPTFIGACSDCSSANGVYVENNMAYVAGDNFNVVNLGTPHIAGEYSGLGEAVLKSGEYYYVASGPAIKVFSVNPLDPMQSTIVGSASDSNSGTSWDGNPEYQWDYENNGVWDTIYNGSSQSVYYLKQSNGLVGRVRDRFGATSSIADQAPVLNNISDVIGTIGTAITFSVTGSDPDGGVLNYSARNLPDGALFVAGNFNWTPNANGLYPITFSIIDQYGAMDEQTIYINIDCQSSCDNKQCGDDGCGGTCGTCSSGFTCLSDQCVCADTCDGKICGSSCGGTIICGICPSGYYCSGGVECKKSKTCFLAGTKILMADGTEKDIEDIQVGDKVMSYDEDTDQFKSGEVTKLIVHQENETNSYLIINEHLRVTPVHAFYTDQGWLEIGKLSVGDTIMNVQGDWESISSIEEVSDQVVTYNLEVSPYQTYIAGGFVVHNAGPGKRPCLSLVNCPRTGE